MQVQQIFNDSIDFLANQEIFSGQGVANAEDEVVLLLMHVLAVDFNGLNQMATTSVTDEQQQQIKALLQQRVEQHVPMAYLVGFAVFAGLHFKVDERALIPRSPFAALIDEGFAPWVDMTACQRVMDMCTGSGCIGLAVAHYYRHCQVDLVDISSAALSLAAENTEHLGLGSQVNLIESDLFTQIEQPCDLILANPPYVDETEYQQLPAEFEHEPRLALVSDRDGMELPVKILLEAPECLTEGGVLFLEVGYNDEVLSACLPKVPLMWVDLSTGGQGICVFSRADLLKYRTEFKHFLESHVA